MILSIKYLKSKNIILESYHFHNIYLKKYLILLYLFENK
jgi:hypothetical protein